MLFHKHIVATAYVDSPPTTEEQMNTWLLQLVEKINMKIFFGPISQYCCECGNEGVTGVVGLTTSHAAVHCWHTVDRPVVKFDVYSCKDFDVQIILDHLAIWKPTSIEYMILDRNDGITVVERESITCVGECSCSKITPKICKSV